ncbi:MAG: POT family MFS transporter [Planctomycetes bacterium]|nr:POT family MFS transporter [Planctomycetota bacterium]
MTNAHHRFATQPAATSGMPHGIPFIVGNEAAERFSFYGMKAILVVFMTQHMLSSTGQPAVLTDTEAREWMHLFVASAYLFPIIGGIVADAFLGKYLTILLLSVVYCFGHLCLALMDLPQPLLAATLPPQGWLLAGLALVAIGSGGIKPCVSAHVGDQFGSANRHMLERVFGWFYFAINFGSFFSTLLTPWLLEHAGPGWAFGVPGILMAVATLVFWLGRNRFVHIPPRGLRYFTETFGPEGLAAILKLVPLYLLVAVFWSLYDQSGGAWVQQAQQMDRRFLGVEWLESQIQAVNPLLVLIFIPLFGGVLYPAIQPYLTPTPLRKILAGFVLTILAFVITAHAQRLVDTEAARFRGLVAPLVAQGSIDVPATAAAMRAAGQLAAASVIEAAAPADVAAVTAAVVQTGLAFTHDGTQLAARWPTVGWQLAAYVVITAAEILVSITCLEFSYTQSPPQMKSLVMSLSLLSVSLGNLFTALVNSFTQDAAGHSLLTGAAYYWFFTGCMAVATVLLLPVLWWYQPHDYLQAESSPDRA